MNNESNIIKGNGIGGRPIFDMCYRDHILCEHNLIDSCSQYKGYNICSGHFIGNECICGSKWSMPNSEKAKDKINEKI
jgi:hypothetical protein